MGEPIEPASGETFEPWWREVAALHGPTPDVEEEARAFAEALPEPID